MYGSKSPRRLVNRGGLALWAIALGLAAGPAGGQEIITVTSANPFNFVALMRDPKAGGEIEIEAELAFPANVASDARLPAMVFVHGSGGPLAHHRVWLDLMLEMGIATVYADHFTPRGRSSAVGSHIELTGAAMTADVLYLLNALADHPRIDPARIGIMGGSKGGGVALYAAWNPVAAAIAGQRRFAVHVPLYPTCVYWEKKDFSGSPIMLMIGENDNWTGVDHCVASAEAFRQAGYDIEVKLYPGAHHGFDSAKTVREVGRAYSVVDCRFVIRADGRDFASGVDMDTAGKKRKALSACTGRGVTYGGDEDALATAKQDLRDFLSRTLLR